MAERETVTTRITDVGEFSPGVTIITTGEVGKEIRLIWSGVCWYKFGDIITFTHEGTLDLTFGGDRRLYYKDVELEESKMCIARRLLSVLDKEWENSHDNEDYHMAVTKAIVAINSVKLYWD